MTQLTTRTTQVTRTTQFNNKSNTTAERHN